jgi:hypothetical protein
LHGHESARLNCPPAHVILSTRQVSIGQFEDSGIRAGSESGGNPVIVVFDGLGWVDDEFAIDFHDESAGKSFPFHAGWVLCWLGVEEMWVWRDCDCRKTSCGVGAPSLLPQVFFYIWLFLVWHAKEGNVVRAADYLLRFIKALCVLKAKSRSKEKIGCSLSCNANASDTAMSHPNFRDDGVCF